MIQLRTKNLKKYYQRGPHLIKALDGIDLEVERGCFLAVMGISGSGKSTLLHLLGGLDEPTEGRVQIGEVILDHLDEEEKSVFRRRKIGFIFQNYNLAPMLNIYENIVFPLTLDGRKPDEPTGNLDTIAGRDVMALLRMMSKKYGQTVVMITHNEELAQMADQIIRLEDGKIVGEHHARE